MALASCFLVLLARTRLTVAHAPHDANMDLNVLPIREHMQLGTMCSTNDRRARRPAGYLSSAHVGLGSFSIHLKELHNKNFCWTNLLLPRHPYRRRLRATSGAETRETCRIQGGGTARRTHGCSPEEDSSQRSEKLQYFSARYDFHGLGYSVSRC